MQFRTRAIHVGQAHDPATGAVVPPIHLASTFVQPDASMTAAYDYARTGSPTRHAFEKTLAENGTRVLKLMLHVSKEEQGERLRERLEVPAKRWKFNPSDLEDRKLWDEYQIAYQAMLQRCSTTHAPWHVIPADSRSRRDAIAARLIRGELEAIKPAYPDPGFRLDQFEID